MTKHAGIWIVLSIALAAGAGCASPKDRVVLFCAQDEEFANGILADFTKDSHLRVDVKYDTEATKSVSLISELLAQKSKPRCDVHWNNEILGTIRLDRAGLLESYASPSAATYPNDTHSPTHTWQAFAARARIIVVNTKLVPESERPRSLLELAEPKWRGKVALAKPQFGTSATQAVCLFEVLGKDKAREYYRALRANEVQLVAGNKQVAEGVGAGQFVAGVTDTDDAMEEIKDGKPIAIIFPDRDSQPPSRMGTLFIPNTVALIKGSPNQAGGKKLIDFLLAPRLRGVLQLRQQPSDTSQSRGGCEPAAANLDAARSQADAGRLGKSGRSLGRSAGVSAHGVCPAAVGRRFSLSGTADEGSGTHRQRLRILGRQP